MRQRIPGRADRHTTVEVFEPSQHEEQAPRVLDRFTLAQGEDRINYEMPSATAGFRYVDPLPEDLEDLERRRRENPSEPTPAQEAKFNTPEVNEELAAGRERQIETEEAEKKLQKRRDEANKRAAKETSDRAKRRGFETAPNVAPQGSNVGNVHVPMVARDPQGHPVRVAEPVPGMGRPRANAGADPHEPTPKSGGVSTPGSAPEEAQESQRVMSEPEVPQPEGGKRRGPKPGSKGAQKKADNAAKRDAKKGAKAEAKGTRKAKK